VKVGNWLRNRRSEIRAYALKAKAYFASIEGDSDEGDATGTPQSSGRAKNEEGVGKLPPEEYEEVVWEKTLKLIQEYFVKSKRSADKSLNGKNWRHILSWPNKMDEVENMVIKE